MDKILLTSYYRDASEIRQAELEACIQMNVMNPLITEIHLFLEGAVSEFPYLKNKKIKIIGDYRPTYKAFFQYINAQNDANKIWMISNTDIFFDESLARLDGIDFRNRCVALSRWHYLQNGGLKLHNEKWSQDTWIFQGNVKPIDFCDFYLGKRGCDNRIAYELDKAGYMLVNPAHSIKTIHYHLSDLHNYGNGFIPKPYLPIPLSHL